MNKIKKALPIVLSIFGSVGVVGTAIVSVKNSRNYYKNAPHTDDKKEKMKDFFKYYWQAILCGSATMASITAGTIISKRAEASLSAAVLLLERGYNKYQGKVKEVFGADAHANILRDVGKDETKELDLPSKTKNGKLLFYNTYIGHFYATQEDVNRALINMNMRLHASIANTVIPWEEKGICTIKQFVNDANAEIVDKKIYESYKDFGWSYEYLSDMCEDEWIYDGYNEKLSNEPDVKVLVFMTLDPIYIPNGWNHEKYLVKRSEKWHGTLIEDDAQADEDLPPWTTYEFDEKEDVESLYPHVDIDANVCEKYTKNFNAKK